MLAAMEVVRLRTSAVRDKFEVTSNSISLVDRELAGGGIEGVYFGPKVWVIARSPSAMLIWIFGHSWSVNGHQSYAQPHLTLLPDRTPQFMNQPRYKNLPAEWTRLTVENLVSTPEIVGHIIEAFEPGALPSICGAIKDRKTAIIEGGAGSLLGLREDWKEWKARGGGFIVLPEGMTEWDACKGKLGWKPRPTSTATSTDIGKTNANS